MKRIEIACVIHEILRCYPGMHTGEVEFVRIDGEDFGEFDLTGERVVAYSPFARDLRAHSLVTVGEMADGKWIILQEIK